MNIDSSPSLFQEISETPPLSIVPLCSGKSFSDTQDRSTTVNNSSYQAEINGDSLDGSDIPYSQEQDFAAAGSGSSGDSTSSCTGEVEATVTPAELQQLQPLRSFISNNANINSDAGALCEDLWSGIFHDYDEERCALGALHAPTSTVDAHMSGGDITEDLLEERAVNHQEGGLQDWTYESPFAEVEVIVDEVDSVLEDRFITEANSILDNVLEEVNSRESACPHETMDSMTVSSRNDCSTPRQVKPLSRLSVLRTFILDSLLEKLKAVANRALHSRGQKLTTVQELLGLLVLHVLCASYNEGPSVVCGAKMSDFFFHMGLSAARYRQVWSALTGCREKRTAVDYSTTGWCRTASRTTSLITDIESEVAAVNRELLYIPGATVLSLDDDHLRMASRAVSSLSFLQQHNNPKKGLGPVGNTLGSALTSVFFACQFTRRGEKLLHTWERLAQLLQGASITGALKPMADAIFAADRGYNTKETLNFVSKTLGASLLGTHKRDMTYPFVFGSGAITRRSKGMVVSEKGCRAVYVATLKSNLSVRRSGRELEACLYRESCSGRIAAMIHNNRRLFKSRSFTIVPHSRFRGQEPLSVLAEEQVIFDADRRVALPQGEQSAKVLNTPGSNQVDQALARIKILTFHQSEDPVWFLLRAFRFTSRTGHSFLATVTRDFENHVSSLAWALRGKQLAVGSDTLPQDHSSCEQLLRVKWECVCKLFGMRLGAEPQPSERRDLALRLERYSRSRINLFNRNDLQQMLGGFARGLSGAPSKTVLVNAVLQLQADIGAGTVELDDDGADSVSLSASLTERASKLLQKLREASLHAWVMKPLVSTAGMKEGSRNEIEVLKAIPSFLSKTRGAYAHTRGVFNAVEYAHSDIRKIVIRHIRSVGLVESKSSTMIADSPDGILACKNEIEESFVCAAEIKTMTALTTVSEATHLREQFGPLTILSDVGSCGAADELFRTLIPSTQYRAQCLHHAATLGLKHVLFIVASSGSVTHGQIIYGCLIQFSEYIRHSYTFTLDSVLSMGFGWVGREPKYIPREYDALLKESHASDINSFASYYSLSTGIRRLIDKDGRPMPPARMIRLTPAVFWNHLKGGVDVISRYLKTLARSNISENPVTSIIARLLVMQVNNAALCFRLFKARELGKLPATIPMENKKGYSKTRHTVTECETFGTYARLLAREWREWRNTEQQERTEAQSVGRHLTPYFSRGAADRYNHGVHQERRLSRSLDHKPVVGQSTYCVLCSWTLRIVRNGKTVTKRKGAKQIQWCSVCLQAVCKGCWQTWHTDEVLRRLSPSAEEVREFNQNRRSKRRRMT
ncbi:unnamed protein product [Chondrus crispus]|uniref:PiggyBac transposable element-derived protein domain-containing protein n=1 Tax=Chondrus crispus TaxID=2769 RepID=R7Q8E0_CHOCR|nr:unnamed protein product [Chondrus crispus]CDF34053.1 unnamed protein product [Chondrus crispus]|eukprot:XP_005713872.1 unnamed protein product [Chondrus crispus]